MRVLQLIRLAMSGRQTARMTIVVMAMVSCALAEDHIANVQQSRLLSVPRVLRPPKLDDFISGKPREAEAMVSDFRQYAPGDGMSASRETAAFLSYDDSNLYVVFVCKEDSTKIRARLSRRENIDADDTVGIDLDTFSDHKHYYRFVANPRGVQLDAMITEGQPPDTIFDTLWYSEGRLTKDGFIVWMAIPFKSLRFSGRSAQTWGIALERSLPRESELSYWPYITQRVEGTAQQFATLQGLDGISRGRNMQFIPYFVLTRGRSFDWVASRPLGTATEARPGMDGKLILHDAFSLDLTINPDFSQVESDEPQVTSNQRFEVFFPEKRSFFIENAGYFQTPINLFFSRRIVDPQAGLRLTGKLRSWSVGVLAADDRVPQEGGAGVGALRVQRDVDEQSSIGVLATTRDLGSSSNQVLSLDTRLKLNSHWVFTGQAAYSKSRDNIEPASSGTAYWSELTRSGRNFGYQGRYEDYHPDFRSELGFVPRVDFRRTQHYVWYMWTRDNSRIVRTGPDLKLTLDWNHRGQLQDWVVDTSAGADLRGPWRLGCRYTNSFEVFASRGFHKYRTNCGVSTSFPGWLQVLAEYGRGTAINYFPASGQPPFSAANATAQFGLTILPTTKLRVSQTYLYTRLGTREGWISGTKTLRSILNNHIFRTKVNYQFSRSLSLRAIVDYNALLTNPSLVVADPTKRLTADVLLTYLVNPGTALYVGYTDIYENLTFPAAGTTGRSGGPAFSTGRQVFLKLNYLFRR